VNRRGNLILSLVAIFAMASVTVGLAFAQGAEEASQTAPPPPPPPPGGEGAEGSVGSAAEGESAEAESAAPQPPAQPPAAPPPAAPPPAQSNAASANPGIAELEGFLEPFFYDLSNRRDPFQPYGEFSPAEETGNLTTLTPAQRWELEKLKLVGIMWDVKDPKAMFLDPVSDVMILGRDESIGNKNGYIAAIREGEVVVVEGIRKKGDIIYRTKVLRIER
jgi:type IV pilus assembly protein PilP